jgi:hypothetical protein
MSIIGVERLAVRGEVAILHLVAGHCFFLLFLFSFSRAARTFAGDADLPPLRPVQAGHTSFCVKWIRQHIPKALVFGTLSNYRTQGFSVLVRSTFVWLPKISYHF